MDVSRCGVRLDILEVQKPCEEIAHTPCVPEMLVERTKSMQNTLEYLLFCNEQRNSAEPLLKNLCD